MSTLHIILYLVPQQFTDQIVGFVPRKHVSTPAGVYSYGGFELQDPETAGGDRYVVVKLLLLCNLRGTTMLCAFCLIFMKCLLIIVIHCLQILHGINWRCLLPPTLPTALPGPTSSSTCAGRRNAEL